MTKYRLTNKTVSDLTHIWNYTFEKWSEIQADKYYQMLLDNFTELAIHPATGKNYFIVTETLLGFRAGRHIIFYHRIAEDEIEIIRILHEQMELKNRLKDK